MDPKHVHKGAFLAEGLWMSLSSSKDAPVWTCVLLDEQDMIYVLVLIGCEFNCDN